MSTRILLVTATTAETEAFRKIAGIMDPSGIFSYGNFDFEVLVTGVGNVSTAWAMTKWFCSNPKPALIINTGIAGSYKDEIDTGQVVVPVSDCFADAGIESGSGFKTLFEAGLEDPGRFPFFEGKIISDNRFVAMTRTQLKHVDAITVNTATGSVETINKLTGKFNPDIETMEGATFFYICSMEKVPFLAFRSISNKVEPRNRNKWNISLALENLSVKIREFILMLE